MNQPENLHIINAQPVPELATAIEGWLAARDQFKIEPTDEHQSDYNATLFDLGAAFAERYPEAGDMPELSDWFRRCLIAPNQE